uniref:Uncharacterized protein n=1 Tax=Rhizophora mucronata TaxID=61149 RepID=A0A2P2IHL1_RHIMU
MEYLTITPSTPF